MDGAFVLEDVVTKEQCEALKNCVLAAAREGSNSEEALMDAALHFFELCFYPFAAECWVEAHRLGYCQEQIAAILLEAFYAPNEKGMRGNYRHNLVLLSEYPYLFERNFLQPEELELQFIPDDEDGKTFYIYEQATRQFRGGQFCPFSDADRPYFFKDLSGQLLVENEYNLHNLRFLVDNVRTSQDFGADNHIYLYYDDFKEFCAHLQLERWDALLKDEKLVFLFGEAQRRAYYPTDFKTLFGIDYSGLKPAPLRPEELKRIVFYYKHAHSGMAYYFPILGKNPCLFCYYGELMYYICQKGGKAAGAVFVKGVKNPSMLYPLDKVVEVLSEYAEVLFKIQDGKKKAFLESFRQTFSNRTNVSGKEVLCACFIALERLDNGAYTERIAPVLVFDPHMWRYDIFMPLLDTFQFSYVEIFSSMRDPRYRLEGSLKYGLLKDAFQTSYLLGSTYVHTQFLAKKYWGKFRLARLEDGKHNPERTFRGVCAWMNVPYCKKMIDTSSDYSFFSQRLQKKLKASDAQTVDVPLDPRVYPNDDLRRITAFYQPILDYYGYDTIAVGDLNFTDAQIAEPYFIEQVISKGFGIPKEKVRQIFKDIILTGLADAREGKVFYPPLIPLWEVEEDV